MGHQISNYRLQSMSSRNQPEDFNVKLSTYFIGMMQAEKAPCYDSTSRSVPKDSEQSRVACHSILDQSMSTKREAQAS